MRLVFGPKGTRMCPHPEHVIGWRKPDGTKETARDHTRARNELKRLRRKDRR